MHLSAAGYKVDIAENGEKALAAFKEVPYDLILMDIQMPVMDGLEATRRIRALGGRFIALPIIAMTAHALSGDADKSLAAGMNAHVTKPIQPQLLFKEIAHWIKPGEKPLMADNQETDEPISKTAMPEIPATETSMPTPMPESLPGIDLTDGLDRLCGNWATYRYILLMFRDKHADAADRLEKFIVEGQWEEAERLAHTLKGGGGNLGAKRLYEQAAALEQNCRAADTENAQAALTTLRSHLDEVMGGLKQLAESGTTTEQSAGSGSVATPLETTVLLDKMLHALDCDLGEAQSCLAALRQQVADSEFAGPLAALQQALNNFDTEAAKETVQALHNLTRSRKEAS
jgi:CheY-like chemotaxis protein